MKLAGIFKNIVLFIIVLLSGNLALHAQHYPEKPSPPRLVNDFAGMLAEGENQALESKLVAYNDSTSTQISIVIINSLEGVEKAQYATELAEKWGIGRKHKDNGVLILVSKSDRQIFIATGRGVEEKLTDALCERIIINKIKPAFKAGNYFQGLNAATDEMISRLQGTFTNDQAADDDKKGIPVWAVILIIIFVLFFIIPFFFRGGGGGGSTLSSAGNVLWALGSLASSGGGNDSGGGGGFGGFGGGDFGGGGAGGSW